MFLKLYAKFCSLEAKYNNNITYLSGDDTGGTCHTQVYEFSNNMLVGNSICEDQSESDMYLEDGFFSDDEIYSDSDDGKYF